MPIYINQQQLQQFTHLELLAKQAVEGFITGLHKSPFHGFSVEFAEHRFYNSGESTRHIDWKLYARTEKLFIKKYEEETNLRCQLVIDNSSSMYYPLIEKDITTQFNKISFSIYSAAAIIQLLKKQRDAVGVSLFSDSVELHTQAKASTVHHRFLFNELEKLLKPDNAAIHKKTFAVEALHQIAENIHKRSLVVIFSDMMDNSEKQAEMFFALQHLKHNKHEVVLFHVTDKEKEVDFDFENRPYTFVDLETGEQVRAHPQQVKENYQKATKQYQKELELKCAQYKIDYIKVDIKEGFNHVLLSYFVKRSKMF